MRVITIVNQKGGVGKTTATVNLGHALAIRGQRVALIDLDPQGHLAASLGHFTAQPGVDRVLIDGQEIAELLIQPREWCSLLTAGEELASFEQKYVGAHRAHALREALDSEIGDFDSVLIDCPPSSGMLTVTAVAAAHDVLVPVAGDYLSLTGLARLMMTLRRLQPMARNDLRKWICMSRFIPRRRLSREVYTKISGHFPHSLLTASISEAAALAECAGVAQSIFEYRGKSKSANEFIDLADALLNQSVVAYEQEETSHVA